MQNNPELVLYSTEGCHLCEMAHSMLVALGVEVTIKDIAFDDALFARYGVTIPVLNYNDNELNWPFEPEQLKKWLEENGIANDS